MGLNNRKQGHLDPKKMQKWKPSYQLIKRIERLVLKIKAKNAQLPQHQRKPLRKNTRYKKLVHVLMQANLAVLTAKN